ncbi:partial Type-5 uracil-DNA glycosylase, partial [uncultured bacterium]
LAEELASLKQGTVILALGTIAHQAVLKALNLKNLAFAHNNTHHLPNGLILIDSYHTSRYNVQTKRLTKADFTAVFENIIKYIS